MTTEATIQVRFDQASNSTPCFLVLKHLEALSRSTQSQDTSESRFLFIITITRKLPDVSLDSSIITVLKQELAKSENNWGITGHPLVIVGTTSKIMQVPSGILPCFKHVIDCEVPRHATCPTPSLILRLQVPDERERLQILKCLLTEYNLSSDVSLQHIATQTAALVAADLRDLVFRAQAACMTRVG